MPQAAQVPADELAQSLITIVGADHVLIDEAERRYLSADVFFTGPVAALAVAPGSRRELAETVRLIHAAGFAIVPRGGGLSYTKGYVPASERSVVIDTRRMHQIIEINDEDQFAIVEAGCTWATLYEALKPRGLRVPHFGPSTGRISTVGGSLSQNSILLGSARYGSAAEHVLGFEIVLPDGSLVRTGSWALRSTSPFFRYHGPDLTGLFVGDGGALGVKAAVALRLMPDPEHEDYLSFAMPTFEALLAVQGAIARSGAAVEILGSGPYVVPGDTPRVPVATLHAVVEGSRGAVTEALACVRRLALHQGHEVEPVVPRLIRRQPFTFVQSLRDPKGRLQAWTHGLTSFSRAPHVYGALVAFFNAQALTMAKYGIEVTISAAVSGGVQLLEPVLYWGDAPREIHRRGLGAADSAPVLAANPAATELAGTLRAGLRDLFVREGAAHLQLGKFYGYREGLDEKTYALLKRLKHAIDPDGALNPGCLGLS